MEHETSIEGYLRWRNGLTEDDYPAIYRSLVRLDITEELLKKGATNEQVSSAILELD